MNAAVQQHLWWGSEGGEEGPFSIAILTGYKMSAVTPSVSCTPKRALRSQRERATSSWPRLLASMRAVLPSESHAFSTAPNCRMGSITQKTLIEKTNLRCLSISYDPDYDMYNKEWAQGIVSNNRGCRATATRRRLDRPVTMSSSDWRPEPSRGRFNGT